MRNRISLTILILLCCHVINAQMSNPLYSGKLVFGNWHTNIRFDSLRVGDTLILKNDNHTLEYLVNFTDSGKVTWYHERMDAGSTSLEIFDEWQQIGTWKKENGNVYVQTTLPEPAFASSKKEKNITFNVISESYALVKLYVAAMTAK